MGLGFVLIGSLGTIFIFSAIIALIGGIITFFVNKTKRKRKTILAIFLPFIFFYSLFFMWFIGSIIVSETKKVDIGIGDTWYAPINDTCRIVMIDEPNIGYIECKGKVAVNNIIQIDHFSNRIIGQNSDLKFFAFNLEENKVNYYSTEEEFIKNEHTDCHTCIDVEKFQSYLYKKATGNLMIFVPILSLIISVLISYLVCKLFLFIVKKIKN
jgi:hypothetical protein